MNINEIDINPIYAEIKSLVINSRNRVYSTVNVEMLNLYWNIGKIIMQIQNGKQRANYGDSLLEELSIKLTKEFGRGFSKRNLERMRKFYLYFEITTTVSSQLSWSHYLELIKIDNDSIYASTYKLHLPTAQELINAIEEKKKNIELNNL